MKSKSPGRLRYAPHAAAVGLAAMGLVVAAGAPSWADQFDLPNSAPVVTINTPTLVIQPDQNGTSRNNGGGDANDKGVYTISTTVSDVDKLADLTNVTLCLYRVTSQGDSACGAANLDARDTMLMRWDRATDSFSIDADGTNTTAITTAATGIANNQSYWRLGHKVTPAETTASAADTFSALVCSQTVSPFATYVGGCNNAINPLTGSANGAPAVGGDYTEGTVSVPMTKGFGSFAASSNTGAGANNVADSTDANDYSYSEYNGTNSSMNMNWRFHASEAAREGTWGVRVIATDSAAATDDESDVSGYDVHYYGAIETQRASVDYGEVLAGATSSNTPGADHSAGYIQANGGTDIEYDLAANWTGGSAPTVETGTVGAAVAGNSVALECDNNSAFNTGVGHAGLRILDTPTELETEQFLNTTSAADSPGQVSEDYANQVSTPADRSTQSCRIMVGSAVTKATYTNTVTVSLTEGATAPQ